MHKKIVAILMVSSLLIGSTVISVQADQLDDAINAQNNVKSEQEKAQSRLKELTFTSDKIKKQLSELDSQISQAQTNLSQKQRAYQQAEKSFAEAQKELELLQENLEERRKVASLRIKTIYEQGGAVGYLEFLFGATDFNNFITRFEYFKYIVESDRKMLEDLRLQQQEVKEKSEELKVIRDRAAQAKEEAAQAKTNIEAKRQEQQKLLNEVKKQQQEEWEEVERLQREEEKWQRQIITLQNQLKGKNPSKGSGQITTWPVPGYTEISSPFGWRINPVTKKRAKHLGIDIPAPTGTPIVAAASGTVIFSGWDNIYGNWVIIDNGGGIVTTYGHNSRNTVQVGQTVEAGDTIAYVGSTGWSTGPHLDFGVRVNGNPVDPLGNFR